MAAKPRRFYTVGTKTVSRASGFELMNGDSLCQHRHPFIVPPGWRGFREFREAPLFSSDSRRGRTHWDLERYSGYWFISDRMKGVLESIDREAFVFVKCKVRHPDGTEAPVRWMCDVITVLDAVDEEKSEIEIAKSDIGDKIYRFRGRRRLIFKDDAVGPHHVFRLQYAPSTVICDETMMLAWKAAKLVGPSFDLHPSRIVNRPRAFDFFIRAGESFRSGDFERAIEAYGEAIRLGVKDRKLDSYFLWRGYAYAKKGSFERAIADYSEVIRLNHKGNEPPAIAARDPAVGLTSLGRAFEARGNAYLEIGDTTRAAEDFQAAKWLGQMPSFG